VSGGDELGSEVRVALRDRYPLPTGVDLLPGLRSPARGHAWRKRVVIVAAVAGVVIVAGVAALLANHAPKRSDVGSVGPLGGVTWVDPVSGGTVVFNSDSVNIDDGCRSGLQVLTMGADWVQIGKPIGMQSVCGGTPGGPGPAVVHFDRVLTGRLSWLRDGDGLTMIDAQGERLELHADGPAPAVVGQRWVLDRVVRRDNELSGDFSSAQLTIDEDGTVHADDLCGRLTGSASESDTTISFAGMHTEQPCLDPGFAPATSAIDSVLRGTIRYAMRGSQLFLYGQDGDLLIYTTAS
jgi:heat shock protein HslJ